MPKTNDNSAKPAATHLRQVLTQRTDAPKSAAWSPDGCLLASGSLDNTVRVWDATNGNLLRVLEGHSGSVLSVAWSPDSRLLASGSYDNTVRVWDTTWGRLVCSLEEHRSSVLSVAWSPDGRLLASGSLDKTVRVWDAIKDKLRRSLEGHTSGLWSVAWSPDSRLLASSSQDEIVRVWDGETGAELKVYEAVYPAHILLEISFQPIVSVATTIGKTKLGDPDIVIRTFELDTSVPTSTGDAMRYVSAKIVLVGESNVGKSCLALRLAQDRYEEQGTTHGMRLWSMPPEQLSAEMAAPPEEKREVVIWDLGGQDEYRLVHQLFLHDTTLALFLFDPTRGSTAFEDVAEWNLRLEKQLRGREAIKLLVGTKLDEETTLIDQTGLDQLRDGCGCRGYFPTSAKTARGIAELRAAIAKEIDWDALSQTTRPILFQRIREAIGERQRRGEAVLLYSELEQQMRVTMPKQFDPAAVNTVVDHLAMQGVIANTRLASGERALVLQIGYIERYAGSLIVAARNNPRGVPAIELSEATGMKSFPGIGEAERLHPFQERIVLECVIQLLLEHTICLKHEGLLIFPALFPSIETDDGVDIAHTVSLYYDFSGAIDNIYSSLVVRLALSGGFGRVRLWKDRAEFEQAGQGLCGLRKMDRKSGLAHLDLLFSEETSSETRDLFTVFVEEHLSREGVEIKEVLGVVCGKCGFSFGEAVVRNRIAEGYADIGCPNCDTRLVISAGAKKARASNPTVEREMIGLKTVIERKSQAEVNEVKRAFAEEQPSGNDPIRILHLSDLHLSQDDDPVMRLQPLIRDLRDEDGGLGFDHLDYLVVSGDLTNRASAEEFERVYSFISELIDRFKITPMRCVIVPGNHDLSWEQEVYGWQQRRKVDLKKLKPGSYVEQGDGLLIRDEGKYPARFENFGKFYHELLQQPYPLKTEVQCIPFLFEETRIQFLAMNSAWEIDEFHKERSSINESALADGLVKAKKQIDDARKNKRLAEDTEVLRIAVWHHPVTGNEKIIKDAFLEQLRQENVRLCLHGHIHEDRADLIGYTHPRKIYTAGAGSFGAPVNDRPEATPRLYNVLEVWRDHSQLRVHTRCLRKDGAAWEGQAIWPGEKPTERRTYYDIQLKG